MRAYVICGGLICGAYAACGKVGSIPALVSQFILRSHNGKRDRKGQIQNWKEK
jgi:hypothetical protein